MTGYEELLPAPSGDGVAGCGVATRCSDGAGAGDIRRHNQSMVAADSEVSRSIWAQSVISGPASSALDFVRRFV
jgi:hypothetical protein